MGGTINLLGVPDFDQFEIVKEGSTTISVGASTIALSTVAHNLGFRPLIMATMDDIGISGAITISDADMPLPTWANLAIDTVNHIVNFTSYLSPLADATNAYIVGINAKTTGIGPLTIKYYLIRKRSK